MNERRIRLAIVSSHPTEYHGPFFRELAKHPRVDAHVYFAWNFGVTETLDREFGVRMKWDIPLTEGYAHTFLKNISPRPRSSSWWGEINLGILSVLRRDRYDAVLIYGWNMCTYWLAFVAALVRGIPILVRGENPLNQELEKPVWKRALKRIVLGWLFRRVRAFLVIGKENRKFYEYYGVPEEKLFFVPYAVDNDRFSKEHERGKGDDTLREELGIGKDAAVILFLGKLIEKKRPFDLLKAYEVTFQNLKSKNKNLSLVFVGDGTLRSGLEKYAREHGLKNVHFAGFKNQTEIPVYYEMADIFVLPSGQGETWGVVVNEAMCFELPVVISNTVGCGPDLVQEGENGFIFPLGDVASLARCLEQLVRDEDLRRRYGRRSREMVEQYSFKEGVERTLSVLDFVIRR